LVKVIKKISKRLIDIQKAGISAELALPTSTTTTSTTRGNHTGGNDSGGGGDDMMIRHKGPLGVGNKEAGGWKTVSATLEDELNEAGDEATRALKEKQREMIDALDLRKSV
jgi:N-acetyltransferase 10